MCALSAAPWHSHLRDVALTGFPWLLVLLCLFGAHLPVESWTYGPLEMSRVGRFILCVDGLQWAAHRATHRRFFGEAVYRAHAVHHFVKYPQATDAFRTGWLDATVQLVIPLACATYITRPNRSVLLVSGFLYSMWLQYIHTASRSTWTSRVFAGPVHHRAHHLNPNVHFAHVFSFWDRWG